MTKKDYSFHYDLDGVLDRACEEAYDDGYEDGKMMALPNFDELFIDENGEIKELEKKTVYHDGVAYTVWNRW